MLLLGEGFLVQQLASSGTFALCAFALGRNRPDELRRLPRGILRFGRGERELRRLPWGLLQRAR